MASIGTEQGPPLCISTHPDTQYPAPSQPTKVARTSANYPSSSIRRLRPFCKYQMQEGAEEEEEEGSQQMWPAVGRLRSAFNFSSPGMPLW
ncbi:unnamed protein product [Leuciscus chuanchicus]